MALEDAPAPAAAPRQRMHWMDRLRTCLTILVVFGHCMGTFVDEDIFMWRAQAGKASAAMKTLWTFYDDATTSYFMGTFFLLAGFCTPGSYNRKGLVRHVWDRFLRLMIPCIIYSLTVPPILGYINDSSPCAMALAQEQADAAWTDEETDAPRVPVTPLAQHFRLYFTGQEPYDGNLFYLGDGPVWFISVLFFFDLLFVAACSLVKSGCWRRCWGCGTRRLAPLVDSLRRHLPGNASSKAAASSDGSGGGAAIEQHVKDVEAASSASSADAAVTPVPGAPHGQFALRRVLVWGAAFIVLQGALGASVRAASYWTLPESPEGWWGGGPFNVEPSMLCLYGSAFLLGAWCYAHSALVRLPSCLAWPCLCVSSLFWPAAFCVAASMPALLDGNGWGTAPLRADLVGFWVVYTLAQHAFGIVFATGLLVFFRDTFNARPGWLGHTLDGASYGAYLCHPLLVTLYARALSSFVFVSTAVNAIAVFYLTAPSAWAVAAVLKRVPGLRRVL